MPIDEILSDFGGLLRVELHLLEGFWAFPTLSTNWLLYIAEFPPNFANSKCKIVQLYGGRKVPGHLEGKIGELSQRKIIIEGTLREKHYKIRQTDQSFEISKINTTLNYSKSVKIFSRVFHHILGKTKHSVSEGGQIQLEVCSPFQTISTHRFRLSLTNEICESDRQKGYILSGTLEIFGRCQKINSNLYKQNYLETVKKNEIKNQNWQVTHFAAVQRKGFSDFLSPKYSFDNYHSLFNPNERLCMKKSISEYPQSAQASSLLGYTNSLYFEEVHDEE